MALPNNRRIFDLAKNMWRQHPDLEFQAPAFPTWRSMFVPWDGLAIEGESVVVSHPYLERFLRERSFVMSWDLAAPETDRTMYVTHPTDANESKPDDTQLPWNDWCAKVDKVIAEYEQFNKEALP